MNSNKYTFKEIKDHIKSKAPLKLQGIDKEGLPEDNWREFLNNFFNKYNQKIPTVYANNESVQTKPGRRRTILDIYRIVYYYFPQVRLTALYRELIELINNKLCCSAICGETNKRVYRGKCGYDTIGFLNSALTDEFGVDFTQFDIEKIPHNEIGWGAEYTEKNLAFINL